MRENLLWSIAEAEKIGLNEEDTIDKCQKEIFLNAEQESSENYYWDNPELRFALLAAGIENAQDIESDNYKYLNRGDYIPGFSSLVMNESGQAISINSNLGIIDSKYNKFISENSSRKFAKGEQTDFRRVQKDKDTVTWDTVAPVENFPEVKFKMKKTGNGKVKITRTTQSDWLYDEGRSKHKESFEVDVPGTYQEEADLIARLMREAVQDHVDSGCINKYKKSRQKYRKRIEAENKRRFKNRSGNSGSSQYNRLPPDSTATWQSHTPYDAIKGRDWV